MRSKNKPAHTKAERAHLDRIKNMECIVCGQPGPSDAHHIKQKSAWYCVPLCKHCHQGPLNGIHGQKMTWQILKMDEMDSLAKTIERLSE